MRNFIQDYPESPKVKSAYFQLGKYNYRKKNWEKVVYWFGLVDAFDLSTNELLEYNFRLGYALFNLEEYVKSASYFHELIDIESPYYAPANYYYAHIAYLEGNYQTALLGFNKLKTDKKFKVVIPYYITQIYYFQEENDSLIAYATPLLEEEKTKRKPEISKLVGDAYFNKKDYQNAIPYLSYYVKEGEDIQREEFFHLGFAQMSINNYEDAITSFSRVSVQDDELAQKAVYNMAECYLAMDNKNYARNAFLKSYNIGLNPQMTEESILSYAKLSYEISYDPYSDAISAFITYLEKYPNALKKDEAFNYLVDIYLSTSNYRSALASLETTKKLDPRLNGVYQKLQYNLAVEQFQNGNYSSAISSFEKSMEHPEDQKIYAQSAYWVAESYYQNGQYQKSADKYKEFIYLPRAILLPEFKSANYNLGYAYYQVKQYSEGAKWFRKYLTYTDLSPSRKTDAYIRTGDCYFITKNYLLSEEYYQKAYQFDMKNADYALFQYATCQGLLKKKNQQLESLELLLKKYPTSSYAYGALYELGKNYMLAGKNELAIANFKKVIDSENNSIYKKKAKEKLGLVYYNTNQNDSALAVFKSVVADYPNYGESKSAIQQIQNIYKAKGDIEGYESYIKSLAFMDISDMALDSISYATAEDFYLDNKILEAAPLFKKYLDRFEHPIFENQAHYYLAECLYAQEAYDQSLIHYAHNVTSKDPLFHKASLERSAELSYKLKEFATALNYFTLLENEVIGLDKLNNVHWWKLKSAIQIDSFEIILLEGEYILTNYPDDVKRETEVKFEMAQAYQNTQDTAKAIEYYENVVKLTTSEKAAQSLYQLAYLDYVQGKIDSSEAVIFTLAQHSPTYPKWLAKGLILLSDIYVLREDYFQARTTLESIVANYDKEDQTYLDAQEKLDQITILENQSLQGPESKEENNVTFDSENEEMFDSLFEEEELEEEILPAQNNNDND